MHTRAAAAVLAAVVCLVGERTAHAQACCTSTSTIFPARLQDSENALVGFRAGASLVYGAFDDQRVLHGQPAGASETDFGQALLVTARAGNEPVQFRPVRSPFENWIGVRRGATRHSVPPWNDVNADSKP